MKLRIACRLPVQLYNTLVALGTTSIVLMPCAVLVDDDETFSLRMLSTRLLGTGS